MPTPTKGKRFGGSPSHQRLILANQAQSLFEHGKIVTTEAKARRLRPYAEHLITKAKSDTLANRRQVLKVIRDKGVVHTLFTEIGPAMATRPGGYTRITKIGLRKGDKAPMAVIEIVEAKEFEPPKPKAEKAAPAKAEEAPAEETAEAEAAEVEETAEVEEAAAEVEETAADAPAESDADEAAADEAVTDEAPADEAVADEADSEAEEPAADEQ